MEIMKQTMLLIPLLLVGVTLPANAAEKAASSQPGQPSIQSPQPGKYVSEQFNFSIETPPEWERQTAAEKGPVLLMVRKEAPPAGTAATTAEVQYKQGVKSNLHDVAVALGSSAKSRDPTAQASPAVAALLGGVPACRISVITKVKQISTRIMYLLAVKNNHLYIFSVSNDPKDPPLTDTIEKSFQFLH